MSHPGIGSVVARYCPIWVPFSALMVLFLGAHEQLPSGSPILGLLWAPTRLTSEFLRFRSQWAPKRPHARWMRVCIYKAHHPLSVGWCEILQMSWVKKFFIVFYCFFIYCNGKYENTIKGYFSNNSMWKIKFEFFQIYIVGGKIRQESKNI